MIDILLSNRVSILGKYRTGEDLLVTIRIAGWADEAEQRFGEKLDDITASPGPEKPKPAVRKGGRHGKARR